MSDVETLPGPADEPGVTPWFPAHVNPVRTGVYQRDMRWGAGVVRYAYWAGNGWRASAATPDIAHKMTARSKVRHVNWRGLTETEYFDRIMRLES